MNRPLRKLVEPDLTITDFLDLVSEAKEDRFELIDGRAVAMTGNTLRHQSLVGNLYTALRERSRPRGCRTYPGDVFIGTGSDDHFLGVPDVFVRCGPPIEGRVITDPVIVVEVLSPSTIVKDRGYKFERYASIPSLTQILLVHQNEARVESWTRSPGSEDDVPAWIMAPFVGLDAALPLPALEADLPLALVYEDVDLSPAAAASA
jgi:Uma2 family endonuclease